VTASLLTEILADHQSVGAIGRRTSIDDLVEQSLGFLEALGGVPPGAFVVDVGSGGGVPALPVIDARPDLRMVLIERRGSRAGLLRGAVRRLEATDRARVVEADALTLERVSEAPCFVIARCAGDPRHVLELASGLVVSGSRLVVSAVAGQPPVDDDERWSAAMQVHVGPWAFHRWIRS
jgi:16S rRNA G527 N7-methylase RsmG